MPLRRAACAVVLLAVCGCGSDGEAAPTPAPAGPLSVPWRLTSVQGTLLEIEVGRTTCTSFQNLEVGSAGGADAPVTITALALPARPPDGAECAALEPEATPFSLAEPLGARKLVHAPVDDAWPGPDSLGRDRR